MVNSATRNREAVTSFFISAFFVGVLLFLSIQGGSGRAYIERPQVKRLPEAYHAFNVWANNGVKGRILFLFDRRLNAGTETVFLSKENYVYLAIRKNMVRKVYHIIPESSWGEVEQALAGNPAVGFSGGVFRATVEGAPVIIMRLKDISPVGEKVLLSINGDYWGNRDVQRIIGLLENDVLEADIVTLSGNISNVNFGKISAYYEKSL